MGEPDREPAAGEEHLHGRGAGAAPHAGAGAERLALQGRSHRYSHTHPTLA